MLSSSEDIFRENIGPYQKAIENAGYQEKLKFDKEIHNRIGKKSKTARSRLVTWYNPPWNILVVTNIGRLVLNLVKKHFPKGHSLNEIFNKNTIKISYSCLKNIKSTISNHNAKIDKLKQEEKLEINKKSCNCRKNKQCPMPENCQESEIVYRAKIVTNNNKQKTYFGLTARTFKERWRRHIDTFNKDSLRDETGISEYIWNCKEKI